MHAAGADPIEAARRVDHMLERPAPFDPAFDRDRRSVETLRSDLDAARGELAAIAALLSSGLGVATGSVSNDVRLAVILAQRAVLIGLARDFAIQETLEIAAETYRVDHLAALMRGRALRFEIESVLGESGPLF